jgi:hypothetical protein
MFNLESALFVLTTNILNPSGNNIPVLAPAAPPLSQGFGGDTVAILLMI